MTREELLEAARRCVCGEREQDYGSPENNFGTIASFWITYLESRGVIRWTEQSIALEIKPCDVACMMALLKIARLAKDPSHTDSWVDLAGYAACGAELAPQKPF